MPSSNAKPVRPRKPEPQPRTEEERLRLARERAQLYREDPLSQTIPPVDRPVDIENVIEDVDSSEEDFPETLEEWQDLVSRRVEEAMRRGMFDNLPGRGKPMPNQHDPFVPEDKQMAFSLMKKNQIAPGWIGDRKSVLGAIESLRFEMREFARLFLAQAEQTRSTAQQAQLAQQWQQYVAEWDEQVKRLNDQILNLNLMQPFHYLEVYKLRLDEELKRAGAARTLPQE